MTDILTKNRVQVSTLYDIVLLRLGTHRIKLYYQATFEIVNSIRMAAKLCTRHEGLQMPNWREVLEHENVQLPQKTKLHNTYRRSGEMANAHKWSIAWEGSLVILNFDELSVSMHYADALRLHVLLRAHARNAKAWSGDPSRARRVTAHLNDAEENYKYGYTV